MDDNKDKYIKDIFKKDDLISKNADDIFNNFLKGDIEVDKNNQDITKDAAQTNEKVIDYSEAKEKRKNNKAKKKVFSAVASIAVLFLAVNTYASTQGYENIFFMIKDLINKDDVVIENKEEILSDRDITISYQPIEVSDGLKLQINNLRIVDNKATLTLTVNENEDVKTRPASYEVYDITNGEKVLLTSQNSATKTDSFIASAPGSSYTEELELDNFKNETTILELDVYSEDEEALITFKINLEEKEIDVLSRKEIVFEKISEVELKDILSKYVALNYYSDTEVFQYIDATMEEAENSLLVELALNMVYEKINQTDDSYTINNAGDINIINTAMNEITGKTYNEALDLIDYDFVYYDVDKNAYCFENGDAFVVPGLCLDISDISYKNGIYTVTCVYCFPGEGDYIEGTIGTLEQYKSTFELKINDDYTFAKYKIVNYDELTSEKVKESDRVVDNLENATNTISDTVIKPTTNTVSNTINVINSGNTVSTTTNTVTVVKPSNNKLNDSELISFLEDVVCVNLFNDTLATTEYYSAEEYENEMKLISAFEIVGGDFMTYQQQEKVFEELYNLSHIDIYGANLIIKNTGKGYEYITKSHQAFATILSVVEEKVVNGVHTVTVVYTYSDKNATIDDDCEKYTVTFRYRENENYTYSKYQVVDLNEVLNRNTNSNENNNSSSTVDVPDNSNENNENQSGSETIDNLASSLNWKTVYSIGMETVMPTSWEMVVYDDSYGGENVQPHGEVATCILGEAKGINKQTNEVVKSNVQINYFTPMFLKQKDIVEARKYIEQLLDVEYTGAGTYVMNTNMSWDFFEKPGSECQVYCSFVELNDGSIIAYVIDIDTDNWDNLKVVNIMNRIIGNTKTCSF